MADISAHLKAISGDLRKAQNAFFNRKFDEALSLADAVAAAIESAKAQDAANVQLKSYENQLAKLRKDVASRSPKAEAPAATPTAPPPAAPAPAPPAAATPAPAAAAPPAPAKLPAGVDKRLRDTRDWLRRGQTDKAAAIFAEIDKSYAGQFDPAHADYVAVKDALEQAQSAQAEAAAAEEAAARAADEKREAMRAQSDEWLAKLGVFAPFGHGTASVTELLTQRQSYTDALPVWQAYAAEAFPAGKADQLVELEQSLARSFEAFPAFFEQTKAQMADEVAASLRGTLDQLGREIEGKPAIMNDRAIAEAEEKLASVQPLLADDAARWAALGQLVADIKARNAANRAARAKLITLRPDAYQGDDAPAIKERAEAMVLKAHPDAQVRRSVVYSEDWKELSQWEDYAGTPRFVTRREIYAQVAAVIPAGCRLFTIYVTKEYRADGTWSALAGNIMFTDEMDEANLG
ncbi:MAG: hypothetical protein FJ290_17585 [Planctomycetes bacterium]|nr:hypothetical protein [Planctomycetota bacterium]